MKFVVHSHRYGEQVIKTNMPGPWGEVEKVLNGITDKDLMGQFPKSKNRMSLSAAINDLIYDRLKYEGWAHEVPIFQDKDYVDRDAERWRLDFAKGDISIEVAFNHGEAIAWNLIKPVLASELNHVRKAIQTRAGIIIMATEKLKSKGAFDGAVGTYEKTLRYMKPLNNILTVPMMIIGLEAPEAFRLVKKKINGKNVGEIVSC